MNNMIVNFRVPGRQVSCERYGCGHINETYLSVMDDGTRYILQKINDRVFPDVDGLMHNIASVSDFIRARASDPREAMEVVRASDGGSYYRDGNGDCWRVYVFVEGSVCLQSAETAADFAESAVAFGRFQNLLADFPAATLTETIKDFHNTPDRYRQLHEALERDAMGLAGGVERELDFILSRQEKCSVMHAMRLDGQLPLRVTHNDAKLNNVLLDAVTRKALCVIDLDTVMPGLAAYDYGDSIRFGASTAAEDERELDRVEMSLELFRVYTRGFIRACPSLTGAELDTLPLGALTMTMECGSRFLADYLDGDHYFAVHRPGHNLDRARTQIKLVQDMEQKWEAMHRVVQDESKR